MIKVDLVRNLNKEIFDLVLGTLSLNGYRVTPPKRIRLQLAEDLTSWSCRTSPEDHWFLVRVPRSSWRSGLSDWELPSHLRPPWRSRKSHLWIDSRDTILLLSRRRLPRKTFDPATRHIQRKPLNLKSRYFRTKLSSFTLEKVISILRIGWISIPFVGNCPWRWSTQGLQLRMKNDSIGKIPMYESDKYDTVWNGCKRP